MAQFSMQEVAEVFIILHHHHGFLYLLCSLYLRSSIYSIRCRRRNKLIVLGCLLLQGMLQGGRYIHDEARTLSFFTLQGNLALMQLHILIHHVQSDARTHLRGSLLLLRTIETLEDMGLFLLGDTAACILHDDTGIATAIDETLAQFYFYHST